MNFKRLHKEFEAIVARNGCEINMAAFKPDPGHSEVWSYVRRPNGDILWHVAILTLDADGDPIDESEVSWYSDDPYHDWVTDDPSDWPMFPRTGWKKVAGEFGVAS